MDNDKWRKYLRIQEEDFSASCESDEGARSLHNQLMTQLSGGNLILDIGCGSGWSSEMLSKMYDKVIGISIQSEEIMYALDNHSSGNVLFCLADMHELPQEDSIADAVYMRECLEHSIAPFIALCEANRVLKMGGQFLVNVPSQDWIDWHCHYFVPNQAQLKSLLTKTGFEVTTDGYTDGGHYWCSSRKINEVSL